MRPVKCENLKRRALSFAFLLSGCARVIEISLRCIRRLLLRRRGKKVPEPTRELVAFQFFTRTLTAYLFAESALHTHTYKQRTAAAELNTKWIYTHGGV